MSVIVDKSLGSVSDHLASTHLAFTDKEVAITPDKQKKLELIMDGNDSRGRTKPPKAQRALQFDSASDSNTSTHSNGSGSDGFSSFNSDQHHTMEDVSLPPKNLGPATSKDATSKDASSTKSSSNEAPIHNTSSNELRSITTALMSNSNRHRGRLTPLKRKALAKSPRIRNRAKSRSVQKKRGPTNPKKLKLNNTKPSVLFSKKQNIMPDCKLVEIVPKLASKGYRVIRLPDTEAPRSVSNEKTINDSDLVLQNVIIESQSSNPSRVKELEEKIQELERTDGSRKQELADKEAELTHFKNHLSAVEKEFTLLKNRFTKMSEQLTETFRELSRLQHKQRNDKLSRDNATIGRITFRNEGVMVQEQWENGPLYFAIQRRQATLKEEKQSIDAEQKRVNALIRNAKKEKDDRTQLPAFSSPQLSEVDETVELDESVKLRAMMLKQDERDIHKDIIKLEFQQKLHIKFVKLMRDEKNSRFNDYPVLNERYILLHLLGKGGFSEVWKAYDLLKLRYVGCKIHQLNNSWHEERKKNYIKHASREYEIQTALSHKRIVALYDVFGIDINTFATVLEFCNGDDLDTRLKQRKMLCEKEARYIMLQIFSGLNYLNGQEKKIIHYDLKPANILFQDGEVKITDFGLSKIMTDEIEMELTSQGAGTYWYLPPETFVTSGSRPPLISSKVDVWSAGVIFYQMLFGTRPFGNDLSQESILSQRTIMNAKRVDFPQKTKISKHTKDFISRCLSHNPAERPAMARIMKDPYWSMPISKTGSTMRKREV